MYSQLNIRTHYTLLSGTLKHKAIIEKALLYKAPAVSFMDTNNMYGTIDMIKLSNKAGIKPIVGVSFLVKNGETFSRINLIAKNKDGYEELLKLVTTAHKNEFPSIQYEDLQNLKGIIAIIPSINNTIIGARKCDEKNISKSIQNHRQCFGDDIYIGLANINNEKSLVEEQSMSIDIAKKHSVPMIANQPIYYLEQDDINVRKILLKIRNTERSHREDEFFVQENYSFLNNDEMEGVFSKYDNALENIAVLTDSVSFSLELGVDTNKWVFPSVKVVSSSHLEDFKNTISAGLKRRGIEPTSEMQERIDLETDIITKRGYIVYFLVMIRIVDYCYRNKIASSARGSVCGSLIAFITGITDVNPITYKIAFERFLNPFRPSPPDIDLDISDRRRGEVVEYIRCEFGKENVAQIITFGSLLARAAVRDTARALGYSYMTGDRIARLIPFPKQGFSVSIDNALEEVNELAILYKNDKDVKYIIDTAKKIEGNSRHYSTHAGGVVVSPTPLIEYTPVQYDETGKSVTQYEMHSIGEDGLGLTKIDVLGLAYLSVVEEATRRIESASGEIIDINNINIEDSAVYDLYTSGKTTGIFQVSSHGMTNVFKRLKPTTLADIAAVVALYRPGPIQVIDNYIKRKHGQEEITYFNEKMKKYLNLSYGLLVYQDDLLYTAIEIAGYDWGEVDVFRKAVGKKIPELMAKQEVQFKAKCQQHSGVTKSEADEIWDLFSPFTGYGFNKAHAYGYAKLSYKTAYLKHHHPSHYMAALLSVAEGSADKTKIYIKELSNMKIKILLPNVNNSDVHYSVSKDEKYIRCAFYGIKNLGAATADAICSERKKNGKYLGIEDFVVRLSPYSCINKKSIESLIKSGALSSLEKQELLLSNVDNILAYEKQKRNDSSTSQGFLFEDTKLDQVSILSNKSIEITESQKLFWEYEYLNAFITDHPLKNFQNSEIFIQRVLDDDSISEVQFPALITSIKFKLNKKNDKFAFITVEDTTGTMEALCPADTLVKYSDYIAPLKAITLVGKVTNRDGEKSITINEVHELS